MKDKISVTIDEKTILSILRGISKGKFRNKSHAVEYALKRLAEEGKHGR